MGVLRVWVDLVDCTILEDRGQRPMDEGLGSEAFSLTRDRALAFPSVPSSSTVRFASVSKVGVRNSSGDQKI